MEPITSAVSIKVRAMLAGLRFREGTWVVALAGLVFLGNISSPPHLMDDVDAVQAQIAKNMLESGDWVTARLNGVPYLEKSPLLYWMIAACFRVFGVHDWVARLPLALCCILLCWTVYRAGRWAENSRMGFYAGIALATSIGLYLFTRILIPDAIVSLTILVALWAWLRLLDGEELHPGRWSLVLGASLGFGLLLKGLIAIVFPILAGFLFMAITRQLAAWPKLRLQWVAVPCLGIAAPWHVLATLANPPYFQMTLHSSPGEYHGFFWFYFLNEHVLRFLNRRYPRDYNTVPRVWFWILNLAWLFPWSVYLPGILGLKYASDTRAGRMRVMSGCLIVTVMLFFTFSTTQEYYSMPIYPALALLIGSSLHAGGRWRSGGHAVMLFVMLLLSASLATTLFMVRSMPAIGGIADALTQHPELYTLSLGHMGDLTLASFAFLRLPLLIAVFAFFLCAAALILFRKNVCRLVWSVAIGMVCFFQAAHLALSRFDSYLSSYPLAVALQQLPQGQLIEADAYYAFSSVFFYTSQKALLLNGRQNNLEYGSYAPGVPNVFIDDRQFTALWMSSKRCYLLTYGAELPRLELLLGQDAMHVVSVNSGNYLLANR